MSMFGSKSQAVAKSQEQPKPQEDRRVEEAIGNDVDGAIAAACESPEVKMLVDAAASLSKNIAERDRLKIERDQFRESARVLESSCENLRRENKKLRESRDHYMQALSSAESDLDSTARMVAKALNNARNHSANGRPPHQHSQSQNGSAKPQQQHRPQPAPPPVARIEPPRGSFIDLDKLAANIGDGAGHEDDVPKIVTGQSAVHGPAQ